MIRTQPHGSGSPRRAGRAAPPSAVRTVTVPGSRRSALVTGLPNRGYYAFTVTAKNVVGLGTPSPRSSTVRTG